MLLSGDISARLGPDVTIVESFEAGNLDKYTGDTANFGVVQDSTRAKDGDYYLEQTDTSFSAIDDYTTRSHYPKQGDAWQTWIYTGTAGGSNTYGAQYFASQSSSQEYWWRVEAGNDSLDLDMEAAGTSSTSVTIASDSWFEVRVEWDDGSTFGGSAGDCTVYLYDSNGVGGGNQLASVSNSDTGATEGGIGWFGADNCEWDYSRITNR